MKLRQAKKIYMSVMIGGNDCQKRMFYLAKNRVSREFKILLSLSNCTSVKRERKRLIREAILL